MNSATVVPTPNRQQCRIITLSVVLIGMFLSGCATEYFQSEGSASSASSATVTQPDSSPPPSPFAGNTPSILGSVFVQPVDMNSAALPNARLYTTVLLTDSHADRNLAFLSVLTKKVKQVNTSRLPAERLQRLNLFIIPNSYKRVIACLKSMGSSQFPPTPKGASDYIEHETSLATTSTARRAVLDLIYDYDSAAEIILGLGRSAKRGPFLISWQTPILTAASDVGPDALIADLSGIHHGAFRRYVKVFLDDIKNRNHWTGEMAGDWGVWVSNAVNRLEAALVSAGVDVLVGKILNWSRPALAGTEPGSDTHQCKKIRQFLG